MAAAWTVSRAGRRPGGRSGELVSDRDGAGPGWTVYLTARSQGLDGRMPTEFDAMASAEAALLPPEDGRSG
jgi:nitroreductase